MIDLAGNVSLSRGSLRRFLWVVPLLGLCGLLFAGTWLRSRMEVAMKAQLQEQLQVLLRADVKALTEWLHLQENVAEVAAEEPTIRGPILELAKLAAEGKATREFLLSCPQRKQIEAALQPWMEELGYVGFVVIDRSSTFLASKAESLIGEPTPAPYRDFEKQVFTQGSTVTRDRKSVV
jgi:hypothetical protein